MHLDPIAFGLTSVMLSAVSGGLLLFSWLQNRTETALAWWGLSFWLCAGSIALVGARGMGAPPVSVMSGNALLAAAFGLQYLGCRVFNGRSAPLPLALVGAGVWLAFWPFFSEWFEARMVLMAAVGSLYCGFMMWELWREAPLRLVSSKALVLVVGCAAAYFTIRLIVGLMPPVEALRELFASRWSSGMAFLLLLYLPSLAFLFLSMAKEKGEFAFRQAALVDPLTRIPNRRAFTADAERFLARHGGGAVSCLVFDLDDFKAINDNYGHEAGDDVLRALADTLATILPGQPFGRLGGDEFAALIPAGEGEARGKAEAVRAGFDAHLARSEGGALRATVSIGCATASGLGLQDHLASADAALYRAKAGGRNRVSGPETGEATLIRFPVRRAYRNKV
ncbi:GGDEF domain-containing protein [Microvirga pudoricolor]|uniref:GGDEF domain-containing protein n=1 Tax=Microvirga pudoricolor TaxID=2778729 RepID=UPI00194E9EC3|nr:GGDEF domain-containing protein [Microvirga pudoricolor]MBM6594256.1 GGDEF domain-containing protein [Microvirga pudoricolor]